MKTVDKLLEMTHQELVDYRKHILSKVEEREEIKRNLIGNILYLQNRLIN